MSGIDPRMIAWLRGTKGPQAEADARRRIAALERAMGLATKNLRADMEASLAAVDAVNDDQATDLSNQADDIAATQADIAEWVGILAASQILVKSTSFGVAGGGAQYGYGWNWGYALRGGWGTATHSGGNGQIVELGSSWGGDTVSHSFQSYAAGTAYVDLYGLPDP